MHYAPSANVADAVEASALQGGDRIAVALEGFCSIGGGPDIACSTLDFCLSGASLIALAEPRIGDRAKLAFRQTGILSCTVTRLRPAGFCAAFDAAPSARLLRFVNWLRHRRSGDAGGFEGRQHVRIVPLRKLAKLTRESGEELLVRTIDVSRSGIAIDRREGFFENERVKVGQHRGTVVRLWDAGAAIAFDEVLSAEEFDVTISFA